MRAQASASTSAEGKSDRRAISMTKVGSGIWIATSLRPILKVPDTPIRWSQARRSTVPGKRVTRRDPDDRLGKREEPDHQAVVVDDRPPKTFPVERRERLQVEPGRKSPGSAREDGTENAAIGLDGIERCRELSDELRLEDVRLAVVELDHRQLLPALASNPLHLLTSASTRTFPWPAAGVTLSCSPHAALDINLLRSPLVSAVPLTLL